MRRPRAGRRRDRGLRPPAGSEVPRHLAPSAPRQDGRLDPRGACRSCRTPTSPRCRSTSTPCERPGAHSSAIVTPPHRQDGEADGRTPPPPEPRRRATPTRWCRRRSHPDRRAGWRQRVKVAGRVRPSGWHRSTMRRPLELILVDGSASISVLFLGRRRIAGVGRRHADGGGGHGRHPQDPPGHPQPQLPAARPRAGAGRPRPSGDRRPRRPARPPARSPTPPGSRW